MNLMIRVIPLYAFCIAHMHIANAATLSCQMQKTLVELTASARDSGIPASRAREVLGKDGELTTEEISAIVQLVYVSGSSLSPATLGTRTYTYCANDKGRVHTSPEAPETVKLSCYNIGYRYAHTATRTMRNAPINPGWDFSVPPRCRNTAELERGIQAGTKAGAR